MSSSGPRYCGTGANFNDGGNVAWNNPTNIQGDTSTTNSNCPMGAGQSSQKLRASNFGFAIGANTIIDGVVAERDGWAGTSSVVDNNIQLLIGGSEAGTNKSVGAAWPTTQQFRSYGASNDSWGNALTTAIVNAVGFGVSWKCNNTGGGGVNAFVYRVRITVYYHVGYTLSAASGSYALTGTPASVLLNRVLPTEAGSFTIAGSSAALLFHRLVTAESGIYSYDGTNVDLLYHRIFPVESGVYDLTGTVANLLKNYLVGVETGEYKLTGKSIAFWNKDSKVLVIYTPETAQVTVFTSETAESTMYTTEEI